MYDISDTKSSKYAGHTTSEFYYYMWRFGWVFYLLALFFEVMAFFAGFLACCGRLGAAISGLVAFTALFFYSVAVSLMTAVFVRARNAFHADGRSASLGKYAFGFSWGAWAALLIATVLFFLGTIRTDKTTKTTTGRRWGRRQSVARSSRSYDVGSTKRVKDDYS